jgi:hypothetical protein
LAQSVPDIFQHALKRRGMLWAEHRVGFAGWITSQFAHCSGHGDHQVSRLTQPAGLSPLKWLSHPCQAQSTPSSATIFAASPGITSTAFITFIALLLSGSSGAIVSTSITGDEVRYGRPYLGDSLIAPPRPRFQPAQRIRAELDGHDPERKKRVKREN